jgi:hypothetical protein
MRIDGRPDHIEDALRHIHNGQWFGWSDSKNKIYANLIIHDESKSKPTEDVVNAKLTELQTAYDDAETKQETDKANANQKLKDLGLTDDEIKAIKGIS